MLQSLKFISVFLSILIINVSAYATNNQPYTTADWEKIAIIVAIIILIISPSKFRVLVIGTILGLVFAYLTYKYLVPVLIEVVD